MKNIPIYRAKKIDSDEYVEGDLCTDYLYENEIYGLPEGEVCVIMEGIHKWWHIDPTTLSIHFPNILDSEGNKIFASLSKDGKGADILIYNNQKIVYKYTLDGCLIRNSIVNERNFSRKHAKVIGIQE